MMPPLEVADAIRRACFRMAADAVQRRAQDLKGTRGPVVFHLTKLAEDICQMGPASESDE